MRLEITVAAGATTALPRIVSLLHRRAATVTYFEYRCHGNGHAVSVDVETSSRSDHLVKAISRLIEVVDVQEASGRATSTLDLETRTSA